MVRLAEHLRAQLGAHAVLVTMARAILLARSRSLLAPVVMSSQNDLLRHAAAHEHRQLVAHLARAS